MMVNLDMMGQDLSNTESPDPQRKHANQLRGRERVRINPRDLGAKEDQTGFLLAAGHRTAVLEPSNREFPIQELDGVEYGQFGPR
eukprot:6189193-Karenia_brevis.AAC.1